MSFYENHDGLKNALELMSKTQHGSERVNNVKPKSCTIKQVLNM